MMYPFEIFLLKKLSSVHQANFYLMKKYSNHIVKYYHTVQKNIVGLT